jgi:hypothetical protein
MDVNADTDGLVRALLRLDEADCSNIVEHLPPRKVKNAFLLLLREIAGLPGTSDIATFGELANPTLLLIVLQEQPVAYAPLAMHPVTAQEPVNTSNKRSMSTEIADDSKRTRIDATVAQNAKQSAAQTLVKEEEEIIEITSEAEDAEAETGIQSKAKDIREPADLKMYLRIPSLSGPDMWKDMDDLPSRVQAELERRFKRMWSSTEEKARRYAELTHDVAKYVTGGCCVYSLVVRGGRSRIKFSRGGRPKETADDRCIRERRPCVHFTRFNDQYVICLVPLPEGVRKNRRWTQLSYWIQ